MLVEKMTFNVKFDTPPMKEDFLHYLFKTKQLGKEFVSTEHQSIKIKNFGFHNFNAGPDFLNAQVEFDNITWAGHIEFHVKSSDWYAHKHETDNAYNNVIVHMVFEDDKEVLIKGHPVPTVVIKDRVDMSLYQNYLDLQKTKNEIPCSQGITAVDPFLIKLQKEKALIERLERKSQRVLDMLESEKGNHVKVLLLLLAEVFGGKVNRDPMRELMKRFQLKWISKLNCDPLEIEALLLGMGAFLDQPVDEYTRILVKKSKLSFYKFELHAMNKVNWKYSRMRPSNFPDFKLAQMAALISLPNFYEKLTTNSLDHKLIQPSAYWSNHFRVGVPSKDKNSAISNSLYDLIRINAVVPYLFGMGIYKNDQTLKDQALEILSSIKPEINSITKEWKSMGITLKTAFDSQALIEQKNEWCSAKKCLFCTIGNEVLKK